ncbi:MAG: cell division protein FtsL [Gammaproteobacteria bacterium]
MLNSAIRVNSYTLSMAHLRELLGDRRFWLILTLMCGIFISALSVVYVQAQSRMFFAELQSMQKQRDNLRVQWRQLLVEQNTWATQARIQTIAEQKLRMVVPKQEDIIVVKE